MASRVRPEPESPCINICRMDADNYYCIGCWRTLDEIRMWSTMSEEERHQVINQLPDRIPV